MWTKVSVIFKLKSPLHVGYMPFGSFVISPTRYYVPGRNFWGAVTKCLTEHLYNLPKAENYREVGRWVGENIRFSYFYLYDENENVLYTPKYTDEGLRYGGMTSSEFEYRFIGSLISTGIEEKGERKGTAKDESLHEIEFINNKYRDKKGKVRDVKIAGCVWIKNGARIKDSVGNYKEVNIKNNNIFVGDFNIIEEFIIGGESKYGYGHVLLDSVKKGECLLPIETIEESESDVGNGELKIKIVEKDDEGEIYLPMPMEYEKQIKFKGEIELLAGRGYFDPSKNGKTSDEQKAGAVISEPKYYFAPGTRIKLKNKSENKYILNWDGTLHLEKN